MWRMSLIAMRFSGFVDAFTHHRKRFGESTEKAFMRAFGGADASPCQRKERHKMEEKEKSPLWRPSPKENRPIAGEAYEKCCSDNPWKVMLSKGREFVELYASRDRKLAESYYEKYCEDASLKGTVSLEDPEGQTVRQRMGFISDEDRWGPGYRPEIVEKGGINDNIFSTLAEAARYFEQNPDADVLPEETPTVPSKKTVPPKSDPGGS